MQLRLYQEECVNNIINMKVGEKKIAQLPTGAGKTIIMSEIARRSKGRVLISVMSSELRQQTIDKLRIICGDDVDVGSVQANLNETDARIVVATRQSLTVSKSNRINELLSNGEFEYILLDECHVAVDQLCKVIKLLGHNSNIIGFTATPFNKKLKKIFDGFIYKKELFEMIKEKYLVEPRCFAVNTDTDLSNVKSVGGEFVQKDLSECVDNNTRNELIVKSYKEKAFNRNKTIVFATSIEHSNNLAKCFEINGISARSIDSTIDKTEREHTLKDFKEGKFKVLLNINILSIGFDEPSVDCVILARPTKSKMVYIQQLGRGLRLSPETGKNDCLVLDIIDNVKKFNLVNTKSIFDVEYGETPLEAEERKKKQSEKEKEERERQLEEQRRIEEEQEKLILQEIEMFNETVSNILNNSNLDWFVTYINGKQVAVLSSRIDKHYAIRKEGLEFKCYLYHNLENYDYEFNLFDSSDNLQELEENIENIAIVDGSNYINTYAKWKFESATDRQIKASKNKLNRNSTKLDAHKFFIGRNLFFAFREID